MKFIVGFSGMYSKGILTESISHNNAINLANLVKKSIQAPNDINEEHIFLLLKEIAKDSQTPITLEKPAMTLFNLEGSAFFLEEGNKNDVDVIFHFNLMDKENSFEFTFNDRDNSQLFITYKKELLEKNPELLAEISKYLDNGLKNNENSANIDFQEQTSSENSNRSKEDGIDRGSTRERDQKTRDDISRENNGAGDNTAREISGYGRGGDSQRVDTRGSARGDSLLGEAEIRTDSRQPMGISTGANFNGRQENQEWNSNTEFETRGYDQGRGSRGYESIISAEGRERTLTDVSGYSDNERQLQSISDRVSLVLQSELFDVLLRRSVENIIADVRKKIYGEISQYSRDVRESSKESSTERGTDLRDTRQARDEISGGLRGDVGDSRREGGLSGRLRGEGLLLYQGDNRGFLSRESEHYRDDNAGYKDRDSIASKESSGFENTGQRNTESASGLYGLDTESLGTSTRHINSLEKDTNGDETHNSTDSNGEIPSETIRFDEESESRRTSEEIGEKYAGNDSESFLENPTNTTTAIAVEEDNGARTYRTFSDREFYTRLTEGIEYRGQVNFNLSPKERFLANIEAIKLSQQILSENRLLATEPEQEILARFSGFGGLKKFLDDDEKGNQELRNLVGQEKLLEIYASADTAFFTPEEVIDDMYAGLNTFGVTKDLPRIRALEPSCGIGHFLTRAPENYEFEAIEKDTITATIAKLLHPKARIYNKGFENVEFEGEFDVVVGNPPYSNESTTDADDSTSIHNYFVKKSQSLLKQRGLSSFIITSFFADAKNDSTRAEIIKSNFLLDAYRMPSNTFKNTGTEVTSDVLFFLKCKKSTTEEFNSSVESILSASGDNYQIAFDKFKNIDGLTRNFANVSNRYYHNGDKRHYVATNVIFFQQTDDLISGVEPFSHSFGGDNNIGAVLADSASIKTNQFGNEVVSYQVENKEQIKRFSIETGGVLNNLYDKEPNPHNDKDFVEENVKFDNADEQSKKINYIDSLRPGNIFELNDEIYQKVSDQKYELAYFEEEAKDKSSISVPEDMIIERKEKGSGFFYKVFPNEIEKEILKNVIAYRDLLKEHINNEKIFDDDKESNAILEREKAQLRDIRARILRQTTAKGFNDNQRHKYDGKKDDGGKIIRHNIKSIIELEKLENYRIFSTENVKKQAKKKGYEKFYELADILKKRVIYPVKDTIAENPLEALNKTLNKKGFISGKTLQSFLPSMPLNDIYKNLVNQKIIFPDFDNVGYVLKADFISGNIKKKYNKIQKMIENKQSFADTESEYAKKHLPYTLPLEEYAQILKEAFPKDLFFEDIETTFGSSFVDVDIYQNFIKDTFFNKEVIKELKGSEGTSDLVDIDIEIKKVGAKFIIEEFCISSKKGSYYQKLDRSSYNQLGKDLEVYNDKHEVKFELREMLERVLNNSSLQVTHTEIAVKDGKEHTKRVVESVPTKNAIDNAEKIKELFKDYLFTKKDFRDRIQDRYNKEINVFSQEKLEYSGFLDYKNMSKELTLRKHQDNAIFKGISKKSMLYDHQVGAGKTLIGITLAMEQKRMGLIRKTLILVPNHLSEQWSKEFAKAYPNANILIDPSTNRNKKTRKEFLYRAQNGDFDAIVMRHSTFENLNVLETMESEVLEREKEALIQMKQKAQAKSHLDVEISNQIKKIDNKLNKTANKMKKDADNEIAFEDLGIDCLIVDEAHNFKNLFITTTQNNVKGLPLTESKKCYKMYSATQYIHKNPGYKLYFLTGTPVSNSIAEFYTMQKYIQPNVLDDLGLLHFDDWQKTFSQIVTSEELDSSGINYALVNRLSKFINTPELMSFYKQNADIITNEDIERLNGRLVPKVKNGGAINVVVPRSDNVARFIGIEDDNGEFNKGSIIWRMNNFAEDPRKNNILACTGEARKAALDFRLINPNVEDFEQSKVNKMVKNVLTHYKDTKYERNTQLIFCDLGVSKENSQKIDINKPTISEFSTIEDIAKHYNLEQRPRYEEEIDKDGNKTGLKIEIGYEWVQYDKDKKGKDENRKIKKVYTTEEVLDIFGNNFDVYSDILKKLVKSGIPQNQIAFIGDAKNDKAKQALFDKVNDGVIRVLIGSTEKMGAGTNVQQRVVAMHELDCPWRPADLEQRLGRVVRQGNLFFDLDKENFEISHYRYSTEQTYDARMFQINEQKLKPLIQIKKSEFLQNQRTFDGIDSELLNISEMKAYATGNPFILEKHKIKGFLDREEKAKEYFYKTKANVERELESAFIEKNRLQEKLEVLQEMLANRGFDKDIYELELFKGQFTTTNKLATKNEEARKDFEALDNIIAEKTRQFQYAPARFTENDTLEYLKANDITLKFKVANNVDGSNSITGIIETSGGKQYRPNNLTYGNNSDNLSKNPMLYSGILQRLKNLFDKDNIEREIKNTKESIRKNEFEIKDKENFLENKTYDRQAILDTLKKDMSNINQIMILRNQFRKEGKKITMESEEIKDLLPTYKALLINEDKFVDPKEAEKILKDIADGNYKESKEIQKPEQPVINNEIIKDEVISWGKDEQKQEANQQESTASENADITQNATNPLTQKDKKEVVAITKIRNLKIDTQDKQLIIDSIKSGNSQLAKEIYSLDFNQILESPEKLKAKTQELIANFELERKAKQETTPESNAAAVENPDKQEAKPKIETKEEQKTEITKEVKEESKPKVSSIDEQIAKIEQATIEFKGFSNKDSIEERMAILEKNQENIKKATRAKALY